MGRILTEEQKQRKREAQKRYRETHKEQIKARSKEYNKKYYWEHKEEKREAKNTYMRERYHKDPERFKEKSKKRYEEKKEEILERNRERKKNNPDYMIQYRKDNSEAIKEYNKRYSKTKRGRANNLLSSYRHNDRIHNRGECTLTAQWIIDNIFTKPCHWCGETDWHKLGCDRIDNDKPHTPDNVLPCCDKCNSKRGTMTYEEFLAYMKNSTTIAPATIV